jgi:nucleoid-associated protein YgaU/DNA-binding SARP family transcriptional activator
MAMNTRSTRAEVAEGLGALSVIAIGLIGIPLLLATIVGWPLPHHLPTITQLHSAAGSQIPDTFWPKALATVAWLAWGYFAFSLATATVDVLRFRRRGTWRRAAGRTSLAALVTAVIVLASIRGTSASSRVTSMPAIATVVDTSHNANIAATTSRPAVLTYTVAPGDSLFDIALTHYGNGEAWRAIYAANVGVRQADGRALDTTNWIHPGWKLVIPDVATPTEAPVADLDASAIPADAPVTEQSALIHTVEPGDNLWSIAVTYYGDGEEWQAIYAANVGVDQPDGAVLSDPSLIYPGWKLTIPAIASPEEEAAPAQNVVPPTTAAPAPISVLPSPSAAVGGNSAPSFAPHSAPESATAQQPPVTTQPGDPTITVPNKRELVPAPAPTSHAQRHRGGHSGDPELPAVAIGGLGVLAAAVIARSLRHRRRMARRTLHPGEMIAASSAPIRDLESALAALIETPAVDWLDLAMRHLTELSDDHPGVVPPIRLVRVGASGVDLILAEAAGVAPGAFEVAEDGWAWTLPPTADLDALSGASRSAAWFSALVPVGEDEDGQTYLAPVEPGTVLPITGPGATAVLAAMATTAGNWSWSEHVTVTSDPNEATTAAPVDPHGPSGQRDRVLYVGAPTDLTPEVLGAIGILTIEDVAGSDLAVICLEDGTVEIAPTQLRLRACRLLPEAHAGIAEALTTAETPPSTAVPEHQMVLGGNVDRDNRTLPLWLDPEVPGSAIEPELELRVLTNAATILRGDEKEINGNGRPFELIALLVLSGGLTKEDARTAIYGSGSSTENISNLAYKARKMLGADSDGEPFLPEASSRGILALTRRVTSDLTRLCEAVTAASTADPSDAIDLYIAALELIEVTPGSPIDHAWSWWIHYAAIAERAAVEAACNLARLTVDTEGDLDAARHGINQARALAPYAEELYRSAITLAGAAGNLGWAQREWDELRRMLSDLSPGASPSPETEAVYHEAMRPKSSEQTEPGHAPQTLVAGVR